MTFNELKKRVYITKVECFKDFWEVRDRNTETIIASGSKEHIKNFISCVLEHE